MGKQQMTPTVKAALITVAILVVLTTQPTNGQPIVQVQPLQQTLNEQLYTITNQQTFITTNAIYQSVLPYRTYTVAYPPPTNGEPSGMATGTGTFTTNYLNEISLAQSYVSAANVALHNFAYETNVTIQQFDLATATLSVKAAVAIYEVDALKSTEFPDDLMVAIYWTAALTEHRLGHLSEAIEYAQKPMKIKPSARAAEVKAVSLFWQSKNTEAKGLLHEWFDPDPNDPDPSNPLNLAYNPRSTPRSPADK